MDKTKDIYMMTAKLLSAIDSKLSSQARSYTCQTCDWKPQNPQTEFKSYFPRNTCLVNGDTSEITKEQFFNSHILHVSLGNCLRLPCLWLNIIKSGNLHHGLDTDLGNQREKNNRGHQTSTWSLGYKKRISFCLTHWKIYQTKLTCQYLCIERCTCLQLLYNCCFWLDRKPPFNKDIKNSLK